MTRSGHARLAAVYALPDAFVVVANHHTQAGFWLAGQPVTRLHSTATDAELGAAATCGDDDIESLATWSRS